MMIWVVSTLGEDHASISIFLLEPYDGFYKRGFSNSLEVLPKMVFSSFRETFSKFVVPNDGI